MRHSILAALLFSPSLLLAQTGAPAVSNTFGTQLSSPLTLIAAEKPTAPLNISGRSTSIPSLRISSGVVYPQIIRSVNPVDSKLLGKLRTKKVVDLVVNEKGEAENIRIVNPSNSLVDASIVEAVSQYVFKPATLDQQPVAVKMELTILFQ